MSEYSNIYHFTMGLTPATNSNLGKVHRQIKKKSEFYKSGKKTEQ